MLSYSCPRTTVCSTLVLLSACVAQLNDQVHLLFSNCTLAIPATESTLETFYKEEALVTVSYLWLHRCLNFLLSQPPFHVHCTLRKCAYKILAVLALKWHLIGSSNEITRKSFVSNSRIYWEFSCGFYHKKIGGFHFEDTKVKNIPFNEIECLWCKENSVRWQNKVEALDFDTNNLNICFLMLKHNATFFSVYIIVIKSRRHESKTTHKTLSRTSIKKIKQQKPKKKTKFFDANQMPTLSYFYYSIFWVCEYLYTV